MRNFFGTYLYDRTGAFKLTIIASPLFVIGLIVKLIASPFFASDYYSSLFIPFLKFFALTGQDPYQHFEIFGITGAFPYPSMMLYVMALPGFIFLPFLEGNIFNITSLELFIYKLPILLADTVILIILSRWLKGHEKTLLILYWLSPVLFYINYLQGQLDAIPIMLVFVFLYLLFHERWWPAYLVLGLAVAAKFHIVLLLPLAVMYVWRKKGIKDSVILSLLAITAFIIVNLPFLFSSGFHSLVFENPVQFKIFDFSITLGTDTAIYIVPLAYLATLLYSATVKFFNRDTFVMLLGFCFGILTIFIPPMPGWYYWIIPFFIYFYVKNPRFPITNFWSLSVLYFAYFLFVPDSDFWRILEPISAAANSWPSPYQLLSARGWNANLVSNLVFSFLQAVLLANVLWIFKRGVEESKKAKLYNVPYLIGVAGDSGSGKSTYTKLLTDIFRPGDIAVVAGDALHKWERGHEMWSKYTHLDPRANDLHDDLIHAHSLQSGEAIYRRTYDHHSGTFTLPSKLESKKLVIFEGLHSFFLSQMRTLLDLKVFIRPEEQLRTHWKVCRDVEERGYSKEKVLEQLQKRQEDSVKYISVQEAYSDIVISLRNQQDLGEHLGTSHPVDTILELRCDNTINLKDFVTRISEHMSVDHLFDERHQTLRISGTVDKESVVALSYKLVPELYEVTSSEPSWSERYNGVIQLFTCYYLFHTLNRKNYAA